MRRKNVFSAVSIMASVLLVASWISGGSSFVPVSEMVRQNGELNADGYCMAKFDLHPEFPLRYKDQRFAATPRKFCDPQPEDLDKVRVWLLRLNRKAKLLTKYLWRDAIPENRNMPIWMMIRGRHWGFWMR